MGDFSIFSILNTGVLGTYTAKLAMSITAHNIANANTDGYSRQRPEIVATPPVPLASLTQTNIAMQLGTGSYVKSVERVRDEFMDVQYREITQDLNYWDKMSLNLHYMEQMVDEPSEEGFRSYFDKVWASFQEVMNDPMNEATISQVQAQATDFIKVYKDLYMNFDELRGNLNNDILLNVDKVNDNLRSVADLNTKIRASYVLNSPPNDLLDERDRLLDQLNQMVGARYRKGDYGYLEIFIGQQIVVHGDQVSEVVANERPGTKDMYDLFVRGSKLDITGGQLSALIDLRDNSIPAYMDRFDELALMLTDKVNLIHNSGFDKTGMVSNIDFFDPLEATRLETPNVYRMAGNNSIMGGPIHYAVETYPNSTSKLSLGTRGSISIVDLNNTFQNTALTSGNFVESDSYEKVMEAIDNMELLTNSARLDSGNFPYDPAGAADLHLRDYTSYTGKGTVFYVTETDVSNPYEVQEGKIDISGLDPVDIDSDGDDNANLKLINLDTGTEITVDNYFYDRVKGEIKFNDTIPENTNIAIRYWTSDTVDISDGTFNTAQLSNPQISFNFDSVVPANNFPAEDDFKVFVKSIRADSMKTDGSDYKSLIGKINDGYDEEGNFDSEKAGSYGELRELLIFDQKGILSKMGFATESQEFLKIKEFSEADDLEFSGVSYSFKSYEEDQAAEEYSVFLQLKDFFSSYEGGDVKITYSAFEDNSGVGYNVVPEGADFRVDGFTGTIEDIDGDGIDNKDLKVFVHGTDQELTWTYDSVNNYILFSSDPGTAVDLVYKKAESHSINLNDDLQYSFSLENRAVDFESITNPAASGDFRTEFFMYKEPKTITFKVPVPDDAGKETLKTYTLTYRNTQELLEKINNNTEMNRYLKAFEFDGVKYIAGKEPLDGIKNVVVDDEFNMLSSTTLKVLSTESYKNLSNIMYSYNWASNNDFAYSNVITAAGTVDIELKNNLKEYEGKGKVYFSVLDNNSGAGYAQEAGKIVDLSSLDIQDISGDGKIDGNDLKVYETGTANQLNYSFINDPNTGPQIKINDAFAGNVDVVYWKNGEENFLSAPTGTTGLATTYTVSLILGAGETQVHFDNIAALVDTSDFKFMVQLPPDTLNLNLGFTDVKIDMNTTGMQEMVEEINENVPSGIMADLTPDNRLVFRAGRGVDFSLGNVKSDDIAYVTYPLEAPDIFWEKMGFLRENFSIGNSWISSTDVVGNYIDQRSERHDESISDVLNVDTRQADGLYGYAKRLDLSSQLKANPMLLAVDLGVWKDKTGDWVGDIHYSSGGTSASVPYALNSAKYSNLLDDGRSNFNDFFGIFVSEMGIEAQTAIRMTANNETMQIQVDNERERVKGVSLDEEMSNMIKYQQAFNAAARVVTAVDQMIQRIIDGMGMAGR